MSELLFEIGCEELPASYARNALAELPAIVSRLLTERGLDVKPEDVRVAGTARRLAVGIATLPDETPRRKKQMKGPPAAAAFKDGKPTKAAEGFAQKCGVPVTALKTEGDYVVVDVDEGGASTAAVLAEALPKVIEAIPFPKVMRWGALDQKFARSVRWLLAAFGGKTVPFTWANTPAGLVTHGHRFLAPGPVQATTWAEYDAALAKAHVILDPAKRREAVRAAADQAAKEVGGSIEADAALLDQISFLIEEPSPVVGSFDKGLLELPREVLVTPMKVHQRYFPVVDAKGALMAHFVTIANVPPKDPKVVARGNERVLRARLADAKYFFDLDLKSSLSQMGEGLARVTFQEKLGSYTEKVERMKVLAGHLRAALGATAPDAKLVDRAVSLAKADLQSKMVFEFPELQGLMGREYARRAGEPKEISDAIAEHYQPRGSGDALPASPIGAIVSLADRLDSLAGIFGIGEKPTGSTDPYGLRRHALAILAIVRARGWSLDLADLLAKASAGFGPKLKDAKTGARDALEFVRLRLEVMLRDEGVPYDAVEAALSARFVDVNEAVARARAIADLKKLPDLEPVAIGFKRARNILADKKAAPDLGGAVDATAFVHDSERALHKAAMEVAEAVHAHSRAGRWPEALRETVKLRGPIDAFYEGVMVMDKDAKVRKNRLALLQEVVDVFGGIADFTKLVPA